MYVHIANIPPYSRVLYANWMCLPGITLHTAIIHNQKHTFGSQSTCEERESAESIYFWPTWYVCYV